MAQDAPAVPELTSAEKTTIKLIQAELQNAQLTVQIHLTRAQTAQALIQSKQIELDLEVGKLRLLKSAAISDFNFDLATLTFTKKGSKDE